MTLTTKTELITQALAQHLLGMNTANRPVSHVRVRALANTMLAGDYKHTGETVQVSTNNVLLDGQHRLFAVVLAAKTMPEISIPMQVSYNVNPDVMPVIGVGKVRTARDLLGMKGFASASYLASSARQHIMLVDDNYDNNKVSNASILQHVEANPDLIIGVRLSERMVKSKLFVSRSVLAAVLYEFILQGEDQSQLEFLIEQCATGEGIDSLDAIYTLRRWLMENTIARRKFSDRLNAIYFARLIKQAILEKPLRRFPLSEAEKLTPIEIIRRGTHAPI